MGTILASAIITSVRRVLLDPTPGVTWADADLLAMLNEGERAICAIKREANPVRGAVTLAAGTKQTLPTGGIAVMEAYENTVSGRRCTLANRELVDAAAPFFPAATQEVDAEHYMKDDRDPTRFDVIPPNDGTGSLQMLYGAVPTALTLTSSAINLLDIYEHALKAFILSQAYAENTDRQDLTKATQYENDWKAMVGISSGSQVAVSPKVGRQGGSA